MRFDLDVQRDQTGVLHGLAGPPGSTLAPFHGVLEMVGLIEARLQALPSPSESIPTGSTDIGGQA